LKLRTEIAYVMQTMIHYIFILEGKYKIIFWV